MGLINLWVPGRTHSGTFKDGDLRVNKDGLRIVSQSEGGEVSRPAPRTKNRVLASYVWKS